MIAATAAHAGDELANPDRTTVTVSPTSAVCGRRWHCTRCSATIKRDVDLLSTGRLFISVLMSVRWRNRHRDNGSQGAGC